MTAPRAPEMTPELQARLDRIHDRAKWQMARKRAEKEGLHGEQLETRTKPA